MTDKRRIRIGDLIAATVAQEEGKPVPLSKLLDQPFDVSTRFDLAALARRLEPEAEVYRKERDRLRQQILDEHGVHITPPENVKELLRRIDAHLTQGGAGQATGKAGQELLAEVGIAAPQAVSILLRNAAHLLRGNPIIPGHRQADLNRVFAEQVRELEDVTRPLNIGYLDRALLEALPPASEYPAGVKPLSGNDLAALMFLFVDPEPGDDEDEDEDKAAGEPGQEPAAGE